MDDLLADFLAETMQSLGDAGEALQRLETAPKDRAAISEILGMLRNISATCGFLRLPRLGVIAHTTEAMARRYEDGRLVPTRRIIMLLREAVDGITSIVAGLAATGREPPGQDGPLIARLIAVSGRPAATAQHRLATPMPDARPA
jgi:two-component system chemotaxis sensor kinase CheA